MENGMMKQFVYNIAEHGRETESEFFQRIGNDGWEVCAVLSQARYLLKREKQTDKKATS